MFTVNNANAVRNAQDASGINVGDGFVNRMQTAFVPVLDCTPDFHRNIQTYASGTSVTGSSRPYTGKQGKTLYIVGAFLSIAKNATCDQATSSIGFTYEANGVTNTLLSVAGVTLTAQDQTVYISLPQPIKCDTNTNVDCAANFSVGAMRRTCIIYGYELDSSGQS